MKSLNKIGDVIGWKIASSIDFLGYLFAFILVAGLMFGVNW